MGFRYTIINMFEIRNRFGAKEGRWFEFLSATEIHPHDRFLERTVLRIIPASVTPNQITMMRVLLTPVVVATIAYGHYQTGVLLFLLTAATDAIDGSLARTRNQITRFGMFFDPLADKLLIGWLVFLLVLQHVNLWLGIAILALEAIIITTALIAKIRFKTVAMANRWGKIKMIIQVIAIFMTLMALLFDFPALLTLAAWLFGIAIGFAVVSLFRWGL